MRPELQSVGNFLAYLIGTSPTRKVEIAKLKNFTNNVEEVLQNNTDITGSYMLTIKDQITGQLRFTPGPPTPP